MRFRCGAVNGKGSHIYFFCSYSVFSAYRFQVRYHEYFFSKSLKTLSILEYYIYIGFMEALQKVFEDNYIIIILLRYYYFINKTSINLCIIYTHLYFQMDAFYFISNPNFSLLILRITFHNLLSYNFQIRCPSNTWVAANGASCCISLCTTHKLVCNCIMC